MSAAVKLATRYLKDRRQPDVAIDLLDEACAMVKVSTLSFVADTVPARQSNAGGDAVEPVTARIVAEVVAERTGIEVSELIGSEARGYLRLAEELNRRVIGQGAAVERVAGRLRLAAAGLRDAHRPMGVFLFLGPTGVGKTHLAESIASLLFASPRNLVRIDMSEFAESHAIARLTGAPPGYIGHDEGGQLTGALASRPHSLVLLDEVEKAHPKVWDLFLQVFDDGRLTDGKGRTVDASHAVFVMTSNLGAGTQEGSRGIGFVSEAESDDAERARRRYLEAVEASFRPELLNRIDEIVIFRPLDEPSIKAIAEGELAKLESALAERSLALVVDPAVLTLLMHEGFSPQFGARHMQRTVENLVGLPLSDHLLAGKARPGGRVTATLEAGAVVMREG